MSEEHSFQARAFPENVPLRALAALVPEAKRSAHEPRLTGPGTIEDLVVREDTTAAPGMAQGVLVVDRLGRPRDGRIYADLRDEFDLGDRFNALELKRCGVPEALELVLDVSRDRRLVLLEASIVVLIVIELALSLLRRG